MEVLKANPIRNGVQHSQVKPKSVEKIKTSLKDVCNAVTISPSTNGTAGKGLESVIVGNQDDELEFLLSLESAEPTRDNITATHTVSVNTSEVSMLNRSGIKIWKKKRQKFHLKCKHKVDTIT